MPRNTSFDSGELRSMAIGYDALSTALSPDVRLTDGRNVMVTNKGAINKRPGTPTFVTNTDFSTSVIDHCTLYETLGTSVKRYVMMSVYNGSVYQVWYTTDDGSGSTTQLTSSTTWINNVLGSSIRPHEFVVSRGLCYIKGAATGVTLPHIFFNGITLGVSTWGIAGPTVPSAITVSSTASTYSFTVNAGWYYVYTWKTLSGQESNRSPLQTDPSKASSNTGSISNNMCPYVTLQGNADTTNIPSVCVYRSTDGGGNFYFLEQVANPGSGSFTYVDRHFTDGLTVPSQPYPDAALDTTRIAPTLTSNSPPPTVSYQDFAFATLSGGCTASAVSVSVNTTYNGISALSILASTITPRLPVTATLGQEQIIITAVSSYTLTITRGVGGTTAAIQPADATFRLTPVTGQDAPSSTTPIVSYSGRLWYGIDNILFYSGGEEISAGVLEESWPSGLNGNFYRFNHPVVNLIDTSEALYVITTEDIFWLQGNTKDSFQLTPIFTDIGGRDGHPRAICTADKSIIFLTSDLRICMARGLKRQFLSDQLASSLKTAVETNGCALHFVRHAYQEKDLLIAMAVKKTDSTVSQQWVFDFNQTDDGLWNVPWTGLFSCGCSALIATTGGGTISKNLILGSFSTSTGKSRLTYMDFTFTTLTDYVPGTGATNQASVYYTVSLVRNPTGNHVNMLREPSMVSVLHGVKIDRTKFTSDSDPTVTYYLDNSTGSSGTTNSSPTTPARRTQSTGYTTLWYMVNTACERVSVKVAEASASALRMEVQMMAFVFNPESGA